MLEFCPRVSVIIPIYNGETDIPGLLETIAQQNYPADRVEYLLIDNNSNDRTPELLTTAVEQLTPKGLNLRYLSENEIQSAYAARNRGIRVAVGEILAFTDADCRPDFNWLTEIVKPFAQDNIALVVGEIQALPGETWLEQYAERVQMMSQKWLVEHPFSPYGQTANLALRREAIAKVGLFRPYLTSGGDADLCWRIQSQTPGQLAYAPTAIVYHRHRNNLRDFYQQWRRYGSSNRYLHELHGVDLGPELTLGATVYRLTRWLLKELPSDTVKIITGKGQPIDLLKTPIGLIGFQARSLGQKEAKLPELARQIDYL